MDREAEKRNSNVELLRIISMIMIIAHHYAYHGGFDFNINAGLFNKILVHILSLGGKIGVNIFVLITGYYLYDSKFRLKKLVKLILEVLFYSIFCNILSFARGMETLQTATVCKMLFPITYSVYWFATSYILLYIFSDFLNLAIRAMNQKKHRMLLILLIICSSIIPTVTSVQNPFADAGWLIIVYLIGAYIHKYPNKYFKCLKLNLMLTSLIVGILIVLVIIFEVCGLSIEDYNRYTAYFIELNKFPGLICSMTFFMLFTNIKMRYCKVVNIIATSMFGVYLLHDHPITRQLLWGNLFKNNAYFTSDFLWLHAIVTIMSILVIGVVIDKLRERLIERPLLLFYDRISKYLKLKVVIR